MERRSRLTIAELCAVCQSSTAATAGSRRNLVSTPAIVLCELQAETVSPLREIGSGLFVSENTVKTHTRNIYRNLNPSSTPTQSRPDASSVCCDRVLVAGNAT